MPGLNSTGPEGRGPRTGRGLGKCRPVSPKEDENSTNENETQNARRGNGIGSRRGSGTGKGLGRRLRRGHA